MTRSPSVIALIPARAGSKRLAGKNVRPLAGHPLLAYTISAALESRVFQTVMVSTESASTAAIARHYGAEVPFLRPAEFAADLSPDIDWVSHALTALRGAGREFDVFSILRPTSPFRGSGTIRRAWSQFKDEEGIDSIRAVESCKQHPGKMWIVENRRMRPLLSGGPLNPPWHSMAYQALTPVYVQNASLEMAWTRVPLEQRTIAGTVIAPFFTEGREGVDLNDSRDWWYAEHLIASGDATLPSITIPAPTLQPTPTAP
ncbi:MAG: CMP-N,N-diacetyllegionaminic acid synthase [Gemmatimonadales bacterium]|nr:CMP-N,N-diacetyllegionaminic acid synthase [Gemmatimonadales bacterium]